MLQKRILVRRGVARRGTRAPSALRRRRAVLLHAPGPPRHMLKARKQMGLGRQSALSEQLLLLGLRQLVVAARSNKQREKKQSHWPGHRGIPRQVPHAIQVFPEEFVPNGDVLFHLPHLCQSLLPVLCHKPRANIDVQRQSGLPLPKLQRSPHRTAQPHKIGLRLHALRQSRVIRAEFFSAPPKAPPRTAQGINDGRNNSTHIPHPPITAASSPHPDNSSGSLYFSIESSWDAMPVKTLLPFFLHCASATANTSLPTFNRPGAPNESTVTSPSSFLTSFHL
ncbi:hypothetical protein TCDM_08862 [Trypanosoma cruzi Dm28c]|uniref:Uncharacterized protein n=1 Tax=Trypanosoma cruzi Dm28c TaxID=1416333 RepID=V5ARF8_TRYCR|nr:hypothetical protein TCDM_08862 [Trypanosoma cruzi Dm28c]